MNKKILLTALSLMVVSSVSMPALANSNLASSQVSVTESQQDNQGLTGFQKISRAYAKESEQEYTYSYTGADGTLNFDNVSLIMKFSEGFHPEKLICGEWKEFEGKINVFIESSGHGLVYLHDCNDEVDLTSYENISEIRLSLLIDRNEYDFSDVRVKGTLIAENAQDTVTAEAVYQGYYTANGEHNSETLSSSTLTTQCGYYTVSKPAISLSESTVAYQGAFHVSYDNISGTGNEECTSYTVDFDIPARTTVDSIQMPVFDGADCSLYINSNMCEAAEGIINVGTPIDKLQMTITPVSSSFSQTGAMMIYCHDTQESTADIDFKIVCKAVFNDEQTIDEASASVHFEGYKTVEPPVTPDIPVTPSKPDTSDDNPSSVPSRPSGNTGSRPAAGTDMITTPEEATLNTPVPVTNVVDFTGMNIQNTVATGSRRSVYDFTSDLSSTESTDTEFGIVNGTTQYEFIDEGLATDDSEDSEDSSEENVKTKAKVAAITEDNSEKSFIDRITDSVKNSRTVQIAMIAGGVSIAALGSIFLALRKPKVK